MALSKITTTLVGASFVIEPFDIKVVELKTGGYQTLRLSKIIADTRVLKEVVRGGGDSSPRYPG